ncbi:DUF3011 domain-containing protein [Stenotrophomonas sp.]|uniref:DUF3011 domain-containing protein n=1 Tax=Stenotrophomonas sp. TaxID=69392 RepID=UPI002FC87A60
MKQGTRAWAWALLPSMLVLAASVQAQHYDRGYDDGYNSGPVRCESNKNRTQQCPLQGRARLVRQLSGSPCVEGQTWGQARDGVWVTQGCRAEFIAEGGRRGGGHGGNGGGWGGGRGQVITCDSNDRRLRRCNVSIRRDARLIRQTSRTACVEGSSWGWDRDGVWVNGGCRGEFQVN